MLCPDLIGRRAEVDGLTRRVEDLAAGRPGGFVALIGEAGAGKSRLMRFAADEASGRGLTVLSGRAGAGGSPLPYRPLRDALLAAFRDDPIPDAPSLRSFRGHLGRLIPSAGEPAAEDSPVLVAEAVVRLLAAVGDEAGAVLLLEDLHWADPETVAVVDYLTDALADQPVLCIGSTRPGGALDAVLRRLRRSGQGGVLDVGPLEPAAVVQMVGACLGVTDPPAHVADFVVAHCDGSPFLVEELLAGLAASGQLRSDGRYWETTGPLTPAVPASLQESIDSRLATLGPTDRRVLSAAALLGRHFDWNLLPGIAGVDGRSAADGLRAAVAEQLITADGDGFVFRHALTREALLGSLLPFERRELASRAWPAVELANPGLPGPVCELAADLAEAAGERHAAAQRLVESARRALRDGALATAEATARRARRLADDDDEVAFDADEMLLQVLAAAGKPADALSLGHGLAERIARIGADAERRVELLLTIARAAVGAGDLDAAHHAVTGARDAAGPEPSEHLLARVEAVASEVALDRGELERAEVLARAAIDRTRDGGEPAVLCEALLTLGRAMRTEDADATHACFAEAAAVAERAGLARWHLRAQQEVALEAWIEWGPPPMLETRRLAVRYGAHITVAVMDLSLADVYLSSFDRDACLRHASACVDASRRFGLATEPVAHLWLAGAHALARDDTAMHASIESALARDPDDPRILADLYGRVLVTRAFVRDELETLRDLTETMMAHVQRAPATTSVYPGRLVWALLCVSDDDDRGERARDAVAEMVARHPFPMFIQAAEIIEAVALGRAGELSAAGARVDAAHRVMAARPYGLGASHTLMMLVARAAIRDGWGEPARWLRPAEAYFTEQGHDLLARRCRALLVEAGAPAPRRRGSTAVPEALRALGVTAREVDVLKLVVAGHTNRQIAEELVLSPKTVERHLSSLFSRLEVTDRYALAERAGTHLS